MNPVGLPQPPVEVSGLTHAAARMALIERGPNVLVPESAGRRWRRWLGPLADPMVVLLLIAAPVYATIGDTTDAIVTVVALVPIVAVGWVLEQRVAMALKRLAALSARTAVVYRDGEYQSVPATEVVVGDLCWVQEGDLIPADGRVVSATQMQTMEAALTGESMPVTKSTSADESEVFAGTTLLAGRGLFQVTAIGSGTRYGQVGRLLAETRSPATPLQRAISRLVRYMAAGALAFCVAVVAVQFARGADWSEAVIAGISLLIAAIPEEFSIVYSLYLTIGAWRLTKEKALVRNLPGVETLGSVTVICSDKTGTLTEGRIEVHEVSPVAGSESDLLEAAVLACEPKPFDPLDRAIIRFAAARGVDVERIHSGELLVDHPFDPHTKHITHVWRQDGREVVAAKGSFEGIVQVSEVGATDFARLQLLHDEHAGIGMRVIAVAVADLDGEPGDRASDEKGLRVVGLIAFHDPVRAGVKSALAAATGAGIRTVMITGDHPTTAEAIADDLGMRHPDGSPAVVATGAELDSAAEGLDDLVRRTDIFARTRPEQKHWLVESFRRQGEVVAMTGDGVNDAPALQAADIGVAMGERGTDVAREAATIVLLDDNFATIVTATSNGRRIYDNLAKAFAYLIAVHLPLVLLALLLPLAGLPLLLVPMQLVLLEVLLHPIVSLVFEAEPAAPDVMNRPPRPAGYALSRQALWRPAMLGITVTAAVAVVFSVALNAGWTEASARGLGFVTLLLAQPLLLWATRSPDQPAWRTPATRQLAWATGVVVAVVIAAVWWQGFGALLKVEAFPVSGWAWAVTAAAIGALWSEPTKRRRSAN